MRHGWLWLFPGIGILLLTGAVAIQVHRASTQDGMQTSPGVVVELVRGCRPMVEFSTPTGEPVRFTGRVCSKPPAYAVGDAVTVRYDPAEPGKAGLDGFRENWFASLVLGFIGAGFTLIGSFLVLPSLLSSRRARALAVSGQEIFAEPVDVQRNTSYSVNGEHPWRIIAQWQNPATGKLHLFRSDNLWFDPSRFVGSRQHIRVLIDPAKPGRYSMDLSFLPELAED